MEWCKLWNGEAATAKQADPSSDKREKEQAADNREVQDRLENYLWKHYEFRFNVLTEQPEYCAKGQGTDTPYKMVTQRTLNTLCLEAHRHRINCWDKDVSRLLHSERLEDYHPFLTYMDTLPQWDGVDRVTPLAQRISKKAFWINGFHRWMLGMAAQWAGRMDRCANAVAPMLVSRMQGKCKSTFCQLLMPDGLRDYYTDSFELTGQSGCEQKLAQFGLINLDEYDRLSPQKLPLLKTLMQMALFVLLQLGAAMQELLRNILAFSRRVDGPAFACLLRCAGILLLTDYARTLCEEAGADTLAWCAGFAGRCLVLAAAFPLLEEICQKIWGLAA